MLFLKLAVVLVLGAIFFEDFKSRSIHSFLFLILGIVCIAIREILGQASWLIISTSLFNIGFLFVQWLFVSAYFSVKFKKWVNVIPEFLGWGDVLFLTGVCFYLSQLNFILFYVASIVFALICWTIIRVASKKTSTFIPLAGLQALFFAIIITGSWWVYLLDLCSDEAFLQLYSRWN